MTLLRYAGALVLGAVTSLASLAVHRSAVAGVPLGLLLGILTTLAVGAWLVTSRLRRSAAAYAAGWLVVFGVAVAGRPEGDYVLAQDTAGWGFIALAVAVAVLGLVALAGGPGPRS